MSDRAEASRGGGTISWTHAALADFRRIWIWKFLGSLAFSAIFFAGYFALLKHPVFPVTTMPLLAIDQAVPFEPQAIWIYGSLWVYVQFAPALLHSGREVVSYGIVLSAMSIFAFAIFFFWPTTLPLLNLDWAHHAGFALLKKADAAGNACPSLHVAFSVFSAIWLHRLLKDFRAPLAVQWGNWLWALAIVYSTMATRQHVALDVASGAILGTFTCLLHFAWISRRRS